MTKLSIVIPVYNVEKYLHKCIKSILESSFIDYELILIDDGSTDNSGLICDDYAKNDERIKIIHTINGGVSKARNIGIKAAGSNWTTFIDADDFISNTFLENLYNETQVNCDVDFVEAGCTNFVDGKISNIEQYYDYYSGNDMDKLFHVYRGLVFSKLFKTSILKNNNISFPEFVFSGEDQLFTTKYLAHIKSYSLLPETGYYYRRDNLSSITHSNSRQTYEQSVKGFIYFYDSMIEYIKEHKNTNPNSHYRLPQLADYLTFTLFQLYKKELSSQERIEHLRKDFRQEHLNTLRCAYGKKNRILFFFLRKGFYWLFDKIAEFYLKR